MSEVPAREQPGEGELPATTTELAGTTPLFTSTSTPRAATASGHATMPVARVQQLETLMTIAATHSTMGPIRCRGVGD
ncbi:hypothetical protein H5410_055670 [Solanum commersonii]|uniref:Uncharacterized protein n=1 Tax=Solanum commersonii TaxID=4109 RepID=A0A9J5WKH8_SOLCO|nr:hypothetical protein H5410_055670 [Solanum commersonii]